MTAARTEADLELVDWQLVHSYRNGRALLRRKNVHPKLRARLESRLPELERRAAERGIPIDLMTAWRAYPGDDGLLGEATVHADGTLDVVVPRGGRRHRRRDPAPSPTTDAGEMLTDLERVLAASIDRARSNTNRTPAKKASEPLTLTDGCNTMSIQSTNAGEPAEEDHLMPTTTTTKLQEQSLVRAHADAIKKYETASTAGVKAGASRRIRELELDMTLEGVTFEPWPGPVTRKQGPAISDEQVIDQLSKLDGVLDDPNVSESIKATASHRRERFAKIAAERGIEVQS